jgi:hypothetical protein
MSARKREHKPLVFDFLMPNGVVFAKIAPLNLRICEGRRSYFLELDDENVKKCLRKAGRRKR